MTLVYMSAESEEFLTRFGIKHRIASAYNPNSNKLAEGAIKAAKRMLRDNTGTQGTLNTDKFLAALLAKRNKPDPKITMSSINVVFSRQSRTSYPSDPAASESRPGGLRCLSHDRL